MKTIWQSIKRGFSGQSLKHAIAAGVTGSGIGTTMTPVDIQHTGINFIIGAAAYILKQILFGSSVKPSLNTQSKTNS